MQRRSSRSASRTKAKLDSSTSPPPMQKSPLSKTKQAKLPFIQNNKRVYAPENI